MAISSALASNCISRYFQPSLFISSSDNSLQSSLSLHPFSYPSYAHHLKLRTTFGVVPTAAASEEAAGGPVAVPDEMMEESKFVPLNAEDPQYGPPEAFILMDDSTLLIFKALLLLGFKPEEAAKIQQLLKDMDGEFLQVVYCTEDMINRSLWEAVHTRQPDLNRVKIAKQLPRICFLSGLSGEEMMMFIDAFEETGLEQAVFAAMVPNSAEKPLQELIDEIMGDHEMLTGNRQGLQ